MPCGCDEDEVGERKLVWCGREGLWLVFCRAEQHVFRQHRVLGIRRLDARILAAVVPC